MKRLKTLIFLLLLSLLSLTLFLTTNFIYLSIPIISITIIYLSGGLTHQYKPVYKYSILAFALFIINFLTMFILFNLDIFNIITILINILVFVIIFILYYLMHKKIISDKILLVYNLTELTIIVRFIPLASFMIFMPWILINLNDTISNNLFNNVGLNISNLILHILAYMFVWFLVIRKNIRFLKQNVMNATFENIKRFILITTLGPIFIQFLVFLINMLSIYQGDLRINLHLLYVTSVIVQITYLRNFAQKLIKKIANQNNGFNNFNANSFETHGLPDDVIDAEIVY